MEVAVKGKVKRRHLSAAACDELGQSSEGPNALSQPSSVHHRQANRGLHPRTPTKRRKRDHKPASASSSPAGKQTGINDFFSVTRVISSSPQKAPRPGPSTSTRPVVDDDEEDEDEDVSLLATVIAIEPQTIATEDEEEEEEVDDVSLLSAETVPERGQTVDHLEGMTAEMFWDEDNDFGEEEETVEALPDAHFGLLGSARGLVEPDGRMEDLPDEVLRQVLAQVPAQDLYRSVSLVCQHWRGIVLDSTFVPFKKQYYRYMKMEKTTHDEMACILKDSGITDPTQFQHCIRNLVILMAQHKVGERVRPDDVLECVKKHRLYPQAEASVTLRIRDIHKRFNLGVQGPNPYAAMAVVLILSESLEDVEALVSLLGGCMSHDAIKEYLWHMATMLLGLERSHIKISNRVHYNIYYVLHLMENGPFCVGSAESGQPQLQLTGEQQQILSHDIHKDQVVKIVAFAGTGKTTTLIKYAEQRPHLRFLYVAFNKSVASEAQRRFPRNVDSRTVHSLAFNDVGRGYHMRKKLTFNLKPFTVNSVLPKGRGGFTKAKVVTTTLNTFMASTDRTISIEHVPYFHASRAGTRKEVDEREKPLFVEDAKRIWSKMKDLDETKTDGYHMTHDGYLKLWQLQIPQPNLSDKYDVIFIDEAQDCTPVIMDVLLSQRCGKILVGDPHQQIYTFKGAVNALQIVHHTHIFYLTQSFRFGAEIAYVGATILKVCKNVRKILVGGKQKGGVCDEEAGRVKECLQTGVSPCRGKTAILSRCNLSVFSEAVRLTDANPSCRVHFVGGVKGIGLMRILDIWRLMQGQGEEANGPVIRDPFIRCFAHKEQNGFWTLKKYAEQAEDRELEAKLSIVEKYQGRIPELASRLERCSEHDSHRADFIVGTVHKAKGLEFEHVVVSDDFVKIPASRHNLRYQPGFSFSRIPDDEWNLLYVAVTRAKSSLIITKNIRRILTVAMEYFLQSEMPGALQTAGEPLPCCVKDCPNCCTPGAAFVMRKRKMECADGVSSGGALCERCVWRRIGPTAFLMTDEVLSMADIPQGFHPLVQGMDHLWMLI